MFIGPNIFKSEIMLKAGRLWDRSVQRIRDKSLNLVFPKAILDKLPVYTFSTPQGKLISEQELGSKIDDDLDRYSNQYLRHLNTSAVRDLHFESSYVNTALFNFVYSPLNDGEICKDLAAKRLEKLASRHLPRVFESAKKLLEKIKDSFTQLSRDVSLSITQTKDPKENDTLLEFLDFLSCLSSPEQRFDPQAEKDIAKAINKSFDVNGDFKLNREELAKLVNIDLPKKFQAWYDDLSQNLEAWKKQADESYKKVIDYLKFDVTRN